MDKRIFYILGCLLLLFASNTSEASVCAQSGYTVATINGIFSNEQDSLLNKNALSYILDDYLNSEPIHVEYIYNPTYMYGVRDIADTLRQGFMDEEYLKSDYDLVEMLKDVSEKIKTEKVLFVGHSQGNFYANLMHDSLAGLPYGIAKQSVGVYSVATPDDRVAGGGKYLTSDTDKIIVGLADKLLSFNVLAPNTHINLNKNDDLDGHSFSKIYLKYKGDQIKNDIYESLLKLRGDPDQDSSKPCVEYTDESLAHKAEGALIKIADYGVRETINSFVSTIKTVAKVMKVIFSLGSKNTASVASLDNDENNLEVVTNVEIPVEVNEEPAEVKEVENDSSENDSLPDSNIKQNNESVDTSETINNESEQNIENDTQESENHHTSSGGSSSRSQNEETQDEQGGQSEEGADNDPDDEGGIGEEDEQENSQGEEGEGEQNDNPENDNENTGDDSTYLVSDINGNSINDIDEDEVILSGEASLSAGSYKFNNLIIKSGAILTILGDPESQEDFKGVKIKAKNLNIENGGIITATRQGYGASSGPGASSSNDIGASYGGLSLRGSSDSIYGNSLLPTDLGSGGTENGGGAIYLEISESLINDGEVVSNGGGSASGGSIYAKTNYLSGDGAFTSSGGGIASGGFFTSPGGGGRIAVYYNNSDFSGKCEAPSGSGSYDGWSPSYAEYGTAGLFDMDDNTMLVKSSWSFEENIDNFDFNEIILENNSKVRTKGNVNITADKLTIEDNSKFDLNSGDQSINIKEIYIDNDSQMTLSKFANLDISDISIKDNSVLTTQKEEEILLDVDKVEIDSTSSINADAKGFEIGPGTTTSPGVSGLEMYNGASYGGAGGGQNGIAYIYGNEDKPVDLGSGGHGYFPLGGGAIKIISDVLINDGSITANGNNTSSGGSIYIITNTLEGSGKFTANGGGKYCPSICYGPGGGGRIAIYYEDKSNFTGEAKALGVISSVMSTDGTVKWFDSNEKESTGDDQPNDDQGDDTGDDDTQGDQTGDNGDGDNGSGDDDTQNVDNEIPYIVDYKFNGVAGSMTTNPNLYPITILITANELVDWISVKLENKNDPTLHKIFQDDTEFCLNGTSSCQKTFDSLAAGSIVPTGEYVLKVHMKDLAGNEFWDYLAPYIITALNN